MPPKTKTKLPPKETKPKPASKANIDWPLIDEMLLDMCEANEIAAALFISSEILSEKIKEKYKMEFSAYRNNKRAKTIQNLRKEQLVLSKSNASMSVWLGKQYLGQKDKHENQDNSVAGKVMPQIIIELQGKKSNLLNLPPSPGNVSNDDDTSDDTETFVL